MSSWKINYRYICTRENSMVFYIWYLNLYQIIFTPVLYVHSFESGVAVRLLHRWNTFPHPVFEVFLRHRKQYFLQYQNYWHVLLNCLCWLKISWIDYRKPRIGGDRGSLMQEAQVIPENGVDMKVSKVLSYSYFVINERPSIPIFCRISYLSSTFPSSVIKTMSNRFSTTIYNMFQCWTGIK